MKDYADKSFARILILDDELAFSDPLADQLSRLGYCVMAVADSAKALRIAEEFKPNIIFLDMKWCEQGSSDFLQEKQGEAILEDLLQSELLTGIPIVFLTNKLTKDEVEDLGGQYMERPLWRKTADAKILIEMFRNSGIALPRGVFLHAA